MQFAYVYIVLAIAWTSAAVSLLLFILFQYLHHYDATDSHCIRTLGILIVKTLTNVLKLFHILYYLPCSMCSSYMFMLVFIAIFVLRCCS